MSYFEDLFNQPLPSKNRSLDGFEDDLFGESGDDDLDKMIDGSLSSFDEFDDSDDEDSELDIDFDDEDDEEELERELEDLDEDMDEYDDEDDEDDLSVHMNIETKYRTPTSVLDPTPAEPLDEVDAEEADEVLNLTATPILVDATMTEAECESAMESGDFNILIHEGFMLESDVADFAAELGDDPSYYFEGAFAPAGKSFKLTKAARFKQLYAISLNIEARAHNDPFYPKMQKAYKIERTIKKGWEKRYGALAKKRAIRYLRRLAQSKSGVAQKIVSKLTKKS